MTVRYDFARLGRACHWSQFRDGLVHRSRVRRGRCRHGVGRPRTAKGSFDTANRYAKWPTLAQQSLVSSHLEQFTQCGHQPPYWSEMPADPQWCDGSLSGMYHRREPITAVSSAPISA